MNMKQMSSRQKPDGQMRKGALPLKEEAPQIQRRTSSGLFSYRARETYGGIVANASEGGVLVYLPETLPMGALLNMEIIYVNGLQLETITAVAKVVWADLATLESLGEHRYGLQFQSIDETNFQRLTSLLKESRK
jgi:c-di-GMP-binding flagellar brake protein YcgR